MISYIRGAVDIIWSNMLNRRRVNISADSWTPIHISSFESRMIPGYSEEAQSSKPVSAETPLEGLFHPIERL